MNDRESNNLGRDAILQDERYQGMTVTRDGAAYLAVHTTREAVVRITLDFGEPRAGSLRTSINFLNHMLEMLGWWGDVAIDATYEAETFRLAHVVAEDTGIALGAACLHAIRDRVAEGVESSGFALAVADEASALAQVSFEGRANAFITRQGASALDSVEDMACPDLVAFFEGFCQGGRCTVHVHLNDDSRDPHHAWEAGFRAFARALRSAFAANPRRAGRTAGVKGTLD